VRETVRETVRSTHPPIVEADSVRGVNKE